MVVLFSKGTFSDKMKIMFDMFDRDKSGSVSREEFRQMIRALVKTTQADLSDRDADDIFNRMLESAGLESKKELSERDFHLILRNHQRELTNIGIHFKGVKQTFQRSRNARTDSFRLENPDPTLKLSWCRRQWNGVETFLEDNRQKIFYLIVFYVICVGLFLERVAQYNYLSEHRDMRRIMGLGISMTRGAAAGISFCFSLMLLTVCRHIITALRETVLIQYIPLDAHIEFHKIVGITALGFTLIHTIGHVINFYHISTQPNEHLACVFKELMVHSEFSPTFGYWLMQTVTGLTGIALYAIINIMYIFALPVVRLRAFKTFWFTHSLYVPFYILCILHGSARFTQAGLFHWYFLGPAVIFTIDKLISIRKKHQELHVIGAELLPSDVTHLKFNRPTNFPYRSGQWIRTSCSAVSADEYHAFTLTSAPHENFLSVHIKAMGRWTCKLRNIFDPNNLHVAPYPRIKVDGPYGGGNQEWYKFEVAVMIGGGIGVTPYASILSDLVYGTSTNKYHGVACKKVYFLWVCPTHRSFEWFIDVLKQVEERDIMNVIEVHIFVTQYFTKFDVRTMMLYICEKHFQSISQRSLFTGLKAINHFGRPDFCKIFKFLREKHKDQSKIGVFSCGPPMITNSIGKACADVNRTRELPTFPHYFENFN